MTSTGPQGYQDYQRTINYDTQPFVEQRVETFNKPVQLGRFFVGRHAYLAGLIFAEQEPVVVTLQWFAVQTGGEELGRREIVFSPEIERPGQLRIMHLGPWLLVTFNGVGVKEKWSAPARLFSSNRVSPLEFIPPVGPLIASAEPKVAAKAETKTWPNTYYAGPVQVEAVIFSVAGELRLWYQPGAPGEVLLYQRALVAGVVEELNITVPAGAWRFGILNVGALEGATRLSVTPSMTGSS